MELGKYAKYASMNGCDWNEGDGWIGVKTSKGKEREKEE